MDLEPDVAVVLDLFRTWGDLRLRPVWLQVRCGWCGRTNRDVASGCMVCIKALRRLAACQESPAWLAWCEALRRDLEDLWVVAEWLEDQGMPEAAAQLRGLTVQACPQCKGAGRIRDRWLTLWPHDGEPCPERDCVGGKVLRGAAGVPGTARG